MTSRSGSNDDEGIVLQIKKIGNSTGLILPKDCLRASS